MHFIWKSQSSNTRLSFMQRIYHLCQALVSIEYNNEPMLQRGAHPGGQEGFGRQLRWVERLADGVGTGPLPATPFPTWMARLDLAKPQSPQGYMGEDTSFSQGCCEGWHLPLAWCLLWATVPPSVIISYILLNPPHVAHAQTGNVGDTILS